MNKRAILDYLNVIDTIIDTMAWLQVTRECSHCRVCRAVDPAIASVLMLEIARRSRRLALKCLEASS